MNSVVSAQHEQNDNVRTVFATLPYDNWKQWEHQNREADQNDVMGGNCFYLSTYCKSLLGEGWTLTFAVKMDGGVSCDIHNCLPEVNHAQLIQKEVDHSSGLVKSLRILELSASDSRTALLINVSRDCFQQTRDHFGAGIKYEYCSTDNQTVVKVYKNKKRNRKNAPDHWVVINLVLVSGYDLNAAAANFRDNAESSTCRGFSFRTIDGPYLVAVMVSESDEHASTDGSTTAPSASPPLLEESHNGAEGSGTVNIYCAMAFKQEDGIFARHPAYSKNFKKSDGAGPMMQSVRKSLIDDKLAQATLTAGFGDNKMEKLDYLLDQLRMHLDTIVHNH
jgi:hypothetical protein